MAETEQNRSEQPTPFKLSRARRKGTVARGMDLGFLTALAGFSAFAWLRGPGAMAQLAGAAQQAMVTGPELAGSPQALLTLSGRVLMAMAGPLVLLTAVVFLAVLGAEILQTGFVFSAEPLRPDFSRLNPGQGLKRVFNVRLLIETAKNLLKFGVYSVLAWLVIRQAETRDVAALADARHLAGFMQAAAFRLFILFVAAAAAFAALDQFIVRRQFLGRMRMSRRELKQESREREGEPRLKQRRKQLHREFAKSSQSLRNVRTADVMIVNPTHVAVALRYDGRTMASPTVVSQGRDDLALRLKKLAFVYGVPIIENPPLARALHQACELNRQVPEAFFRPVADIYLALRARERARREPAHA